MCGRPQEFDVNKEFAGKKVVLVSVPGMWPLRVYPYSSSNPSYSQPVILADATDSGAFTPGCQAFHVPPYIQKLDELKAKGVDAVAIIAFNDAFVMNAWGKVNKAKEPIVSPFLADC